jgi:uncharacterized protein
MKEVDALDKLLAQLKDKLSQFPEIEVAFLFGSAVKNRLTASSDLDIGIAANTSLAPERKNEIGLALSRLTDREIDLIDLQTVSGTILQQILCTGIIIKKSSVPYARLLKKMWFDQADMMPYTRMILEKHCQRFVHG